MMYNQKLESVGEEGESVIKPKRFIERFKCVSKSSCLRHYGGYSVGVPPLPIPNREVKPVRADGTAYSGRVGSRRPFRLSAALEKVSPQRHSLFPGLSFLFSWAHPFVKIWLISQHGCKKMVFRQRFLVLCFPSWDFGLLTGFAYWFFRTFEKL